jgi:hypothetical protein
MSLPLHLRAYQEPTKDDLTRLLFNVPPLLWVMPQASPSYDPAMEISAILSVEGKDEVYVRIDNRDDCRYRYCFLLKHFGYRSVWKAASTATFPLFHVARQTLRTLHITTIHHSTGREVSSRLCMDSQRPRD